MCITGDRPNDSVTKQVGGTGAVTSTVDKLQGSIRPRRQHSSDLQDVSTSSTTSSTILVGMSSSNRRPDGAKMTKEDLTGESGESRPPNNLLLPECEPEGEEALRKGTVKWNVLS